MGIYDILVDGDKTVQVKCFKDPGLRTYKVGDKTPFRRTVTILLPDYEEAKFAIIEKGIFVGLTNDLSKAKPPFISKWGKKCKTIEDIENWNLLPRNLKP